MDAHDAARLRHDFEVLVAGLRGRRPRALIVGIDRYRGPDVQILSDAVNNARSVREVLMNNAQRSSTRILLVRRPGRHERTPERRWILAGLDAPTRAGNWRVDDDLLMAAEELTRDVTRSNRPSDPILLVCTHGVHDTCCALRGRPVAASLAKHWPEAAWECSHIGGDRFAPNVVVLPDGFYYGNLDPDSAIDVVGQHLAGTVSSTHLRGMARYSPPVQAAVAAAYERCAPLGPRDVAIRTVDRDGPHDGHGSQTTVELDIAGRPGPVRVEVRRYAGQPPSSPAGPAGHPATTEYPGAVVRVRRC
jgi:hypothetical protein